MKHLHKHTSLEIILAHTHQGCYGCFIIAFYQKEREKESKGKGRETAGGRAGKNLVEGSS